MTRTRRFLSSLTPALTAVAMACAGGGDGGDEMPDTAQAMAEAPTPGLLDPNDATRDQLLALPHFDPAFADALIAARPYGDMLEVDAVLADGLSEAQREEIYGRLFKPLDLNAATGAEILLIPGVGERLEHEFMEYRPYRAMEEFRREIGKYVNEAEVARLEQYVMLP